MSYTFSKEKTNFRFQNKELIIKWLDNSIHNEKVNPGEISFVFCSDNHLLSMNKKYLKHNFYTDVITFDYSENKLVSGDIFISIDRVVDNAKLFKVGFQDELLRVMIHGVLHLCGYKDKSPAKARQMRLKEDYYLSLFPKSK